jgi:ATPase involved in DNA repair
MQNRLSQLKEKLQKEVSKKELLMEQLTKEKESLTTHEQFLETALKARSVVQVVAEATQKKLEYRISSLVSMALASIWEDPYEFHLRFVQRRNKTECDLIFSKNGNETDDILNSGGGGVADVAGFALRVALWSIKKSRPCILMDEPFRFVSVDLQEKCSDMVKEISTKLGIQIIIVSHLPEIIKTADKIIRIENVNGESKIYNI